MGVGKKPPKEDCFAYDENEFGKPICKALNDIFCTYEDEECHFYKLKKRGRNNERKTS